jgi:hypothetical protein
MVKMCVIEGYLNTREFIEIKNRPDVTVLKKTAKKNELGDIWVRLDIDWSIMELLDKFED